MPDKDKPPVTRVWRYNDERGIMRLIDLPKVPEGIPRRLEQRSVEHE
jgi:hypothetical protein